MSGAKVIVTVPVELRFSVPAGTDPKEVRAALEATLEYSAASLSMDGMCDQLNDRLAKDRDDEDPGFEYDGYEVTR